MHLGFTVDSHGKTDAADGGVGDGEKSGGTSGDLGRHSRVAAGSEAFGGIPGRDGAGAGADSASVCGCAFGGR